MGIDTIRFILVSKTLRKFLDDNKLQMEDYSENVMINRALQNIKLNQNRDEDVKVVAIGNIKNISGYILIKQNLESIEASKKGNRKQDYKCEVIFTGLRQPTKTIDIGTYEVLYLFIKRFKISTLDICLDGLSSIAINSKNKGRLNLLFKDYINNHNETKIEKTSFYLNNPNGIDRDTDYFKRVLVYDKYIKETRHKSHKIDDRLENWKRVEATISIDAKLSDIFFDDYIVDVVNLANKYMHFDDVNIDYIEVTIQHPTIKTV